MPRTFKDTLASDAKAQMDPTYFGTIGVMHNPGGRKAEGVAVEFAFADFDNESSSTVADANGHRIVREIQLDLLTTVNVNVADRGEFADTFTINDEEWWAVNIVARDEATQTVLLRRSEPVSTKKTRGV